MIQLKFVLFVLLLLAVNPARGDFGNWFVANQRLSTPLDSAEKKLSFRFTCQDDMTLSAAAIYCVEASNPPAYEISLQADVKGSPSGEPLRSEEHTSELQSLRHL